MILLLLFGSQSVPPFAQYLTDCAVVLVRVTLMHQRTVTLAKDHKGVHRPSDVVLFPLCVGVNEKEEKTAIILLKCKQDCDDTFNSHQHYFHFLMYVHL